MLFSTPNTSSYLSSKCFPFLLPHLILTFKFRGFAQRHPTSPSSSFTLSSLTRITMKSCISIALLAVAVAAAPTPDIPTGLGEVGDGLSTVVHGLGTALGGGTVASGTTDTTGGVSGGASGALNGGITGGSTGSGINGGTAGTGSTVGNGASTGTSGLGSTGTGTLTGGNTAANLDEFDEFAGILAAAEALSAQPGHHHVAVNFRADKHEE
ncbi:hypothetical protein HGRIS_000364 [Hohenbuehelia grisea]|uniref:Uncharacterized protein n=2 Tax=Hohenbuehelia grisea TaxID=104357 RepID=A0ABR3JS76_9AGAR